MNLRHLSIFNGEREYEGKNNNNANTIFSLTGDFLGKVLSKLVFLEEINLQWLKLTGDIESVGLFQLKNLIHLNLAYNYLGLSLPLGGWANL